MFTMKKPNVHMNLFLKSDVLIIESKIVKNNFFSSFFLVGTALVYQKVNEYHLIQNIVKYINRL